MLTEHDSALLTRVGPGTAMGDLMRQHWLPFYLSDDVRAGEQPQRVRLLGEDFLVWRSSEGKVGLIDPSCAHRGAPLVFGRNEDCGLRCVFHGWKYDIDGRCVDMPTEPVNSRFKERIRLRAYPCAERNGVVWAYLGDRENPELPSLEWNLVPSERVHVSIRVQECNWLQAMEGDIDSAHAPVLHGRVDNAGLLSGTYSSQDLRPVFEVLRRDFGVSIAASRQAQDGDLYWRVNQFVLPFWTLTPPLGSHPELSGHAWVPIDDENTLVVMFSYHPSEPLPADMVELFAQGYRGRESGHPSAGSRPPGAGTAPFGRYATVYTRANDYGFDYASQVAKYFSGLPGLWVQDVGCQNTLTPIANHAAEHLCSGDAGIVAVRRLLLESAAAAHETGRLSPTAADPQLSMVRSVGLLLKKGERWDEAASRFMVAELDAPFGYDVP